MKIYKGLDVDFFSNGCVATIGIFDGVHSAHLILLKKLRLNSAKYNLPSVIITFWPHPRSILQPNIELQFLTTPSEKYSLIEKTGLVDAIIEIPFSLEFSEISAQKFIENILIEKLKIKALILGYDHHFGKNREGNIRFFDFKNYSFDVLEIEKQTLNNNTINSTNIRKLLNDGDIENANLLLGRPFSIKGIVEEGKKIGRTLGFPTANIKTSLIEKIHPKGVFLVHVFVRNSKYNGLLNVGIRPTLDGLKLTVEVHILDFNLSIYDEEIEVYLIKKIREELKFDSLGSLKNQIIEDKKLALLLLETNY